MKENRNTTDPLERNFQNSGEETETVVVPRIINQTRRTSSSTAPIHQDDNTRRTRNEWPSRIRPRNVFVRLEPLVKETRKQANFDAPPKERTDLDKKPTARDELDFDKTDDNEDESSLVVRCLVPRILAIVHSLVIININSIVGGATQKRSSREFLWYIRGKLLSIQQPRPSQTNRHHEPRQTDCGCFSLVTRQYPLRHDTPSQNHDNLG